MVVNGQTVFWCWLVSGDDECGSNGMDSGFLVRQRLRYKSGSLLQISSLRVANPHKYILTSNSPLVKTRWVPKQNSCWFSAVGCLCMNQWKLRRDGVENQDTPPFSHRKWEPLLRIPTTRPVPQRLVFSIHTEMGRRRPKGVSCLRNMREGEWKIWNFDIQNLIPK